MVPFLLQYFALQVKMCHHERMFLYPMILPGDHAYIWWFDNGLPHIMGATYLPSIAPWTGRVFIEFLNKKSPSMDSRDGVKYRRMTLLPTSSSIKWRSITAPGSPALKVLVPLVFEAHINPSHVQLALLGHPVIQ